MRTSPLHPFYPSDLQKSYRPQLCSVRSQWGNWDQISWDSKLQFTEFAGYVTCLSGCMWKAAKGNAQSHSFSSKSEGRKREGFLQGGKYILLTKKEGCISQVQRKYALGFMSYNLIVQWIFNSNSGMRGCTIIFEKGPCCVTKANPEPIM